MLKISKYTYLHPLLYASVAKLMVAFFWVCNVTVCLKIKPMHITYAKSKNKAKSKNAKAIEPKPKFVFYTCVRRNTFQLTGNFPRQMTQSSAFPSLCSQIMVTDKRWISTKSHCKTEVCCRFRK